MFQVQGDTLIMKQHQNEAQKKLSIKFFCPYIWELKFDNQIVAFIEN
jgi:hypothetical protein